MITEPPDAPPDIKVMEHDGRSARISWSAPYSGNSPITHYLVQYKLESGKFWIILFQESKVFLFCFKKRA
jgi:hypothetical protein